MKKTSKLQEFRGDRLIVKAVFTMALVLSLSLFSGWFSIVSHAESAGRVSSSGGANVRSSASASGSVLTSWEQNTIVSIRSQVQASDGYIWYEVWVDADNLGYVRSDLVEITDGTTPPTSTQVAPSNPETPAATGAQPTVEVTAVNPISATVQGSSSVRVRSDASTSNSSQIITTVGSGLALTVTGQATGTDGNIWYLVNFISNNTEITGFIRSDFVALSGDLTPYEEPQEEPQEPVDVGDDTQVSPEPDISKPYETMFQNDKWYLVLMDTETQDGYPIDELLAYAQGNSPVLQDLQGTIKSQKAAIVVLVILLVAALGGAAFLVFKIKDMMDSAYFNEVENETLRRRSAQGGQKAMQNAGTDKKPQGQRPGAPQRPAGAGQGQRPAGAPPQRTPGAGQGKRPAGAPPQRPAGAGQGQRPTGAPKGQRPAEAGQGQRPAGAPQGQNPAKNQPKNFMADDDEFEFEFLNYDGDEVK